MNAAIGIARRVDKRTARAAFNRGETIAVANRGYETSFDVFPTTTVHSSATTSWEWLVDQVETWSNRYPHQRYYLVSYGPTPVIDVAETDEPALCQCGRHYIGEGFTHYDWVAMVIPTAIKEV